MDNESYAFMDNESYAFIAKRFPKLRFKKNHPFKEKPRFYLFNKGSTPKTSYK